jgi:hypothetical protein
LLFRAGSKRAFRKKDYSAHFGADCEFADNRRVDDEYLATES